MTVADDSRFRHRRLDRLMMWAGHYFGWFTVINLAASAVYTFLPTRQQNGPVGLALNAITILWLITLIWDIRVHQARLCDRCAAATPLNPQAQVNRWRSLLRLFHKRPAVFVFVGAYFALIVVGGLLPPKSPAAIATQLAPMPVIAAIFFMIGKHRALQPWCPWCRWDDGGDHEQAPIPTIPAAR